MCSCFDVYLRADNAYTVHDTVYIACNQADKCATGLGFYRNVFQHEVLYFIGYRAIVIIFIELSNDAKEADDFRRGGSVERFLIRAGGGFEKVVIAVFNRQVGDGVAFAVKVPQERVFLGADGRKYVFHFFAVFVDVFHVDIFRQAEIDGVNFSGFIVNNVEEAKVLQPREVVQLQRVGNFKRAGYDFARFISYDIFRTVARFKVRLVYVTGNIDGGAEAVVRHPCKYLGTTTYREDGNQGHCACRYTKAELF